MRPDFRHQQTISMADRNFASLDKDEIDKIMDNAEGKIKKRQTNTSVTLIRQYLTAGNIPTDFESFGIEQLDDVLSTFNLEMKNKDERCIKRRLCSPIDKVFKGI